MGKHPVLELNEYIAQGGTTLNGILTKLKALKGDNPEFYDGDEDEKNKKNNPGYYLAFVKEGVFDKRFSYDTFSEQNLGAIKRKDLNALEKKIENKRFTTLDKYNLDIPVKRNTNPTLNSRPQLSTIQEDYYEENLNSLWVTIKNKIIAFNGEYELKNTDLMCKISDIENSKNWNVQEILKSEKNGDITLLYTLLADKDIKIKLDTFGSNALEKDFLLAFFRKEDPAVKLSDNTLKELIFHFDSDEYQRKYRNAIFRSLVSSEQFKKEILGNTVSDNAVKSYLNASQFLNYEKDKIEIGSAFQSSGIEGRTPGKFEQIFATKLLDKVIKPIAEQWTANLFAHEINGRTLKNIAEELLHETNCNEANLVKALELIRDKESEINEIAAHLETDGTFKDFNTEVLAPINELNDEINKLKSDIDTNSSIINETFNAALGAIKDNAGTIEGLLCKVRTVASKLKEIEKFKSLGQELDQKLGTSEENNVCTFIAKLPDQVCIDKIKKIKNLYGRKEKVENKLTEVRGNSMLTDFYNKALSRIKKDLTMAEDDAKPEKAAIGKLQQKVNKLFNAVKGIDDFCNSHKDLFGAIKFISDNYTEFEAFIENETPPTPASTSHGPETKVLKVKQILDNTKNIQTLLKRFMEGKASQGDCGTPSYVPGVKGKNLWTAKNVNNFIQQKLLLNFNAIGRPEIEYPKIKDDTGKSIPYTAPTCPYCPNAEQGLQQIFTQDSLVKMVKSCPQSS